MKRFAWLTIAIALIISGCSDADNILSSVESVEVDTAPPPSVETSLVDFSGGGGIIYPASACDPDPQGGVGGKVLSLNCIEDPSDPGGEDDPPCVKFTGQLGVPCSELAGTRADMVRGYFNSPGYRSTDPYCNLMRSRITTLVTGYGYEGAAPGKPVLILTGVSVGGSTIARAVWFNLGIFAPGFEHRDQAFGYAAYMATFLHDDHAAAEQARLYCTGATETPPTWPNLQ